MIKTLFRNILALLGRLLPLRAAIAISRLIPKLAHILDAKGEFVFTEPGTGVSFAVNCYSNIDRMLVRGDYAKEFDPILDRLVNTDSSAIDCGANIGAVSLRLVARMTGGAKLVAIEPGPTLYARLTQNIELNPAVHARAIAVQAGVSDRPGELFWNADIINQGNANLLGTSGLRVRVTTVDAIIAEHRVEHVGFIKIDVEGMELEVIKGAAGVIQRDHPVLYYEASLGYEQKLGRKYVLEIEQLLNSWGYQVGYWDHGFREIQYPDIRANLVAVHASKIH